MQRPVIRFLRACKPSHATRREPQADSYIEASATNPACRQYGGIASTEITTIFHLTSKSHLQVAVYVLAQAPGRPTWSTSFAYFSITGEMVSGRPVVRQDRHAISSSVTLRFNYTNAGFSCTKHDRLCKRSTRQTCKNPPLTSSVQSWLSRSALCGYAHSSRQWGVERNKVTRLHRPPSSNGDGEAGHCCVSYAEWCGQWRSNTTTVTGFIAFVVNLVWAAQVRAVLLCTIVKAMKRQMQQDYKRLPPTFVKWSWLSRSVLCVLC